MKIITALITPYDSKNKINYSKIKELIDYQILHNSSGIVIGGSTGERHLLTEYEEIKLYTFVCNNYGDKIDIFIGIGEVSTSKTIHKIKKYNKLNCKGYLINVPCYVLPPQENIYQYFLDISNETNKDIIVYDIEKRSGISLDIATIKDIIKIPNIIGIKESTRSLKRLKILVNENLPIILGDDKWYLWGLTKEMKCIISVMSNCELDLMINPYKNLASYKEKLKEINKYVNPIGIKKFMNKKGLNVGNCRKPL